jgi:hypothetical protein
MTLKRKLGIAAAVLVVVLTAGLIVVLREHETGPVITATLIGYLPGDSNVMIQIVNHGLRKIEWVQGAIGPHESERLFFVLDPEQSAIALRFRNAADSSILTRVRNYLSEVGDYDLRTRAVWTNVSIPLSPPKSANSP